MQLPEIQAAPVGSELSYKGLKRPSRGLVQELSWASKVLAPHLLALKSFRALAQTLEEGVLRNDLTAARATLDRVEEQHGQSTWWLEARLALDQAQYGLDRQKQSAAEIRRKKPNSLIAYLGRLFSVRNEPTTTLNSFFADAEERISRLKSQHSLRDYLRFRVLWNVELPQRALANVLLVAQGLSAIDLYETLVEVSLRLVVSDRSSNTYDTIARIAEELLGVGDTRWCKISLILGRIPAGWGHVAPTRIADELLTTTNPSVWRSALRQLLHAPSQPRLAFLLSIMAVDGKVRSSTGGSPWAHVIRSTSQLFLCAETFPVELLDLEKFLRNFSFSLSLRSFYYLLRADLSSSTDEKKRMKIAAALLDRCPHVEELYLFSRTVRAKLNLNESTLSRVYDAVSAGGAIPRDVIGPVRTYFKINTSLEKSDAPQLIALDREAQETHLRPLIAFARRSLIAALVLEQDIPALMDEVTNAYFYLQLPDALIPIGPDFASARWRDLKAYAASLKLPLILHLSWRITGSDQAASNLRFAMSDFLSAHKISDIAQLESLRGIWPDCEFIYFLKLVCVPEVLDMSGLIESSRAASEARREIYAILARIDPAGRELYELESMAITHALSVQDGLRVLDSSRVHVDTAAITSWAIREWSPNLSRYIALVEAGIGVSESLEEVLRDLGTKHLSAKRFLEIPESDADAILADMINGLRNRFLLDPSHGLDSYLSRRVRHHSMSGHLRGVLEDRHLITTKDHATRKYRQNGHWNRTIADLTATESQEIQRALARFAEEFDRILTDLKEDIFRIRSPERPKGIFSILISPAIFHLVRGAVQRAPSVETLCAVCYPIFWASLRPALEDAQSILKGATLNAIASSFHRLKAAMRRVLGQPQRYHQISIAIQSSSDELNRQIASIADWFNRTEASQVDQQFSLERALEISVEAALHSCKPFAPKMEMHVAEGKTVSSVMFVQLAELVLTILGNARQHGGAGREPFVKFDVGLSDMRLRLRVESAIGPSASSGESRARVEAIRQSIADGSYLERVRNEGNSGLKKVASVALQDPMGTIDFGFIEDKRFFVEVVYELSDTVVLTATSS